MKNIDSFYHFPPMLPYYIHHLHGHLVRESYYGSSHHVCIPGGKEKEVEGRTRKHNSRMNDLPSKRLS